MSEGDKIGNSITGAFKAVGDLGEGLRKNINGLADSVGRGIANDSSHGGPAVPDTVNHDTLSSTTKPGGTFGDGTHDRSGLTNSTTASGDVHPDVKALGTELEKGVAKLNK